MWKNHADSKHDSQYAHSAIPDYQPLMIMPQSEQLLELLAL